MSGSLSDSESAETALVFVNKVAKKTGSAEEITELSRLARKCPSILPRAMSVMDRATRRLSRGQLRNDKLEKEMKEVVTQKDGQIEQLKERYDRAAAEISDLKKAGNKITTIVALERQVGEKSAAIAALERQLADANRRIREAEVQKRDQKRVTDRRIGCAKIRVSDLERKVEDKNATIASLERQLAEAECDAADAKTLRRELEAAKAKCNDDEVTKLRRELEVSEQLLASYKQHSKKMRYLFGQRGVVRSQSLVCPREVEEALAKITAANPVVNTERRVIEVDEVDREATTEEDSDN